MWTLTSRFYHYEYLAHQTASLNQYLWSCRDQIEGHRDIHQYGSKYDEIVQVWTGQSNCPMDCNKIT